jgi:ACS family hexuronate transporter-like MFS transporter
MPTAVRPAESRFRWVICALLFFATVIAYVDRGVLSFLERYLEGIFGWHSVQYSYMTTGFQIAYGIGLLTAGRLTDRLGTRKGFALAIVLWSLAAMAPGAAVGTATFVSVAYWSLFAMLGGPSLGVRLAQATADPEREDESESADRFR